MNENAKNDELSISLQPKSQDVNQRKHLKGNAIILPTTMCKVASDCDPSWKMKIVIQVRKAADIKKNIMSVCEDPF